MAEAKSKFSNFKEAFCAYHRCPPEGFLRKALFYGIPPSRRLLAIPIYLFNRSFFAIDFGILEALAGARTAEEFSVTLDELTFTSRVERSIRRGFFGIRISESRLFDSWEAVAPFVRVPEESIEGGTVTPNPRPNPRFEQATMDGPPGRETPLQAVVARRLRRATAEVTCGKPVELAAREAGLSGEVEFLRLLAQQAGSDPAMRWLLGQMQLARRVQQLEREVAGLHVIIGDRELQLQRLQQEQEVPTV
jgi:hypothetical protein